MGKWKRRARDWKACSKQGDMVANSWHEFYKRRHKWARAWKAAAKRQRAVNRILSAHNAAQHSIVMAVLKAAGETGGELVAARKRIRELEAQLAAAKRYVADDWSACSGPAQSAIQSEALKIDAAIMGDADREA